MISGGQSLEQPPPAAAGAVDALEEKGIYVSAHISSIYGIKDESFNFVEAEKEPEYMVGDVNKDGYLDVKDVTQLQMFLAKYKNSDGTPLLDEANPQDFAIADFNANNIIDVADVTEIQMFLATNKV